MGRKEARAGGMQKEPEGTVVCKDHPEHLDHPGRSLDLKRLKASVAHRSEDLERGADLPEGRFGGSGQETHCRGPQPHHP